VWGVGYPTLYTLHPTPHLIMVNLRVVVLADLERCGQDLSHQREGVVEGHHGCCPSKVGRNTVTGGGPVTVTVTEPIPCYRSREGLFSVCLARGNQLRSCYRSGNEPLLPLSKV